MAENRKYNPSPLLLPFILVGLGISAWFNTEWNIPNLSAAVNAELPMVDSVQQPSIVSEISTIDGASQLMISITAFGDNQVIHFTTDGSTPTVNSPIYERPFEAKAVTTELGNVRTAVKWKPPFNKLLNCPVIRAIALENGVGRSSVATLSFPPMNSQLPVLAINGSPEGLFGATAGIYVVGNAMLANATVRQLKGKYHIDWWDMPANYHQRGEDWQRKVNIEFFENGSQMMNVSGGVRLNGNATRSFPQKSLRLYAPEKSSFYHAFFGNAFPAEFQHLILRNSGNDWGRTMFRDILANEIMRGTAVEVQPYKQTVVYLNGEYWGIHNLRPRLNEDYIATRHNVSLKELTILEKNAELYYGEKGEAAAFKNLVQLVNSNDLTDKTIYRQIKSAIDIDNFIDYLWIEIYLVNTDWPSNNMKYYHVHPEKESRKTTPWRFILMDTDYGFGYTYPTSYATNMFSHLDNSNSYAAQLFRGLCQNESFCKQFVLRGEQLMETQFNPIRINRLIDQLRGNIAGEMESHINRWRQPQSMEEWEKEIDVVRRFVAERPAILNAQAKAYFSEKLEE